jgi:TonB family protein
MTSLTCLVLLLLVLSATSSDETSASQSSKPTHDDPCKGEHIRHLGGDVKEPIEISRPKLEYPPEARRAGISGVVITEAVVANTGCVISARIVQAAHPLLDAAAIENVKQWQFMPATEFKRPVCAYMTIALTFQANVASPTR